MWVVLLLSALVALCAGSPWVAWQNESQMLLLHWPVDTALVQSKIPPGLKAATYKGQAYLGLAALWMADMSPRFVPPTPLGRFAELDFYTVVEDCTGALGLTMFSIDAGMNSVLEWFARTFGGMPYMSSDVTFNHTGPNAMHFKAERKDKSATFEASYRYDPASGYYPQNGTLDEFLYPHLTGYFRKAGDVYAMREEHVPWRLFNATTTVSVNTIAQVYGFPAPTNYRVRYTTGAYTVDHMPAKVVCSTK